MAIRQFFNHCAYIIDAPFIGTRLIPVIGILVDIIRHLLAGELAPFQEMFNSIQAACHTKSRR